MPHGLNFVAGWWLILIAFVGGAILGLGIHREDYLGGYNSYRRRMLRLGHIALAALGMINLLYGLSLGAGASAGWPGGLLLAGAIAMPTVCGLAAWRTPCRHLFFIPVTLLLAAVILILVRIRA